ncbi:Sodium/hydrogen exchanger [Sanghuangporus baumii]|uniref:Sodium/hydrogen exchanger n=1 Tax=Sanghuangporus baumii TaxID=108892 RepID=A0A9Q5HSJ5_SANBA|nr:Sodium/hydrogen exchanger [Sanghuangporus baumii]
MVPYTPYTPYIIRAYIVVLGTTFGIVIGPHCAGISDTRAWDSTSLADTENRITLEVMRVIIATGLFAIGVELPKAYLAEHVRSLLVMVIPTMAFGWFIVAGIIKALFPALNFVSLLAIAACLTPTDPVLAASIIGGIFAIRHVPVHIRALLSQHEFLPNTGCGPPKTSAKSAEKERLNWSDWNPRLAAGSRRMVHFGHAFRDPLRGALPEPIDELRSASRLTESED